jgi:hypothetical protein
LQPVHAERSQQSYILRPEGPQNFNLAPGSDLLALVGDANPGGNSAEDFQFSFVPLCRLKGQDGIRAWWQPRASGHNLGGIWSKCSVRCHDREPKGIVAAGAESIG